jgi:hypothetical protein
MKDADHIEQISARVFHEPVGVVIEIVRTSLIVSRLVSGKSCSKRSMSKSVKSLAVRLRRSSNLRRWLQTS